jgi:hypothetical protein
LQLGESKLFWRPRRFPHRGGPDDAAPKLDATASKAVEMFIRDARAAYGDGLVRFVLFGSRARGEGAATLTSWSFSGSSAIGSRIVTGFGHKAARGCRFSPFYFAYRRDSLHEPSAHSSCRVESVKQRYAMSTSPSVVPRKQSLYEDDLYAWTTRQATLIRAGRVDELDLDHIAEELDDLGSEIYRRLESALTVLFAHMLKWDYQPERRTRSWEATIREQIKRIAKMLEKNPSLKSKLAEATTEGYEYGRDRASGETDMPVESFPEKSGYTWHDVMEREFRLDEPEPSQTSGPSTGRGS